MWWCSRAEKGNFLRLQAMTSSSSEAHASIEKAANHHHYLYNSLNPHILVFDPSTCVPHSPDLSSCLYVIATFTQRIDCKKPYQLLAPAIMLKNGLEPLASRLKTPHLPLKTTKYFQTLRLPRLQAPAPKIIHAAHLHTRPATQSLRSLLPTIRLHVRAISTKPLPTRGPIFHFFYRFFAYAGGFILVSGGLVVAFFLYDASTYHEIPVVGDVPVSLSALNPPRGGPKNLPIIDALIDCDDCEDPIEHKSKPKLVVLGTGWGSVALLKALRPEEYHIIVVSPVNYFLFTPMLPSATVGTLELRSLVEPVRRIVHRVRGHFLKAQGVDVDFSEKLVEVAQLDCNGVEQHFYLPYDKLVIGVGESSIAPNPIQLMSPGSTSNPHGVKGLENCNYLKTIDDARQIRNKVLQNLEQACLPTTSDEERKRLLSFVISGGWPTGVEFAAELNDLLN